MKDRFNMMGFEDEVGIGIEIGWGPFFHSFCTVCTVWWFLKIIQVSFANWGYVSELELDKVLSLCSFQSKDLIQVSVETSFFHFAQVGGDLVS